jgi:hypothetical protein
MLEILKEWDEGLFFYTFHQQYQIQIQFIELYESKDENFYCRFGFLDKSFVLAKMLELARVMIAHGTTTSKVIIVQIRF